MRAQKRKPSIRNGKISSDPFYDRLTLTFVTALVSKCCVVMKRLSEDLSFFLCLPHHHTIMHLLCTLTLFFIFSPLVSLSATFIGYNLWVWWVVIIILIYYYIAMIDAGWRDITKKFVACPRLRPLDSVHAATVLASAGLSRCSPSSRCR